MSPNGGTATRGVRRLREALGQTAVIFVSAPTGYGKTFVVREALRMRGMPACWYEAQPWEGDGFLEPLVERIRVARPDVGRRTLALAQSGAPPERLGVTFADELTHVDAPLCIVVDGVEHLEERIFAPFADALVARLPRSLSLVLISRARPHVVLGALSEGRAVFGALG